MPKFVAAGGRTFALLGDQRALGVVALLSGGAQRFGALRAGVHGVAPRTLYRTLRDLQRAGILIREVLPTSPPRVVYELTTLGRSLAGPVGVLTRWVRVNGGKIEARLPPKESGRPASRRSARL